ncbi:hypothetical protein LSCM1_01908 [Leishmania martiniquensis]|uniref:GPI transamidase component Tta1 n=1 Tax=Leishmania martiniquensis TaxID=1580590 RepID=A0A836KFE6_9TRYP|nr:hypothetical protein LSCM1_01908 [Leishmania martiniquensis]
MARPLSQTVPLPPSAASSEEWRRNSTRSFSALSAFIFFVVMIVHWTTLSREHVDLPMNRVLADLQARCPTSASTAASTSAIPPPAFYGLGVWVDSPALLPGVHAALALVKERLAGSPTTSVATVPLPTHTLHSFVRLQSRMRDAVVAEFVDQAWNDRLPSAQQAMRRLDHLARQQQLGLPALQHAFAPEIGQDVALLGVSLFRVPASALPADVASGVQCFLVDVRQGYCALPVEDADSGGADDAGSKTMPLLAASRTPMLYQLRATSLEAEVRAALLSVIARQLGLASFKPADVAAWKLSRERLGCLYTIASLTSTMRSVAANKNMAIPHSTERMFADLERHVQSGSFVRAARAADDLQFHPSLTPQLHIPWEHAVISQLIVLLPILSSTLIAIRFLVEELLQNRARAKVAIKTKDAKKIQ